MIDGCVCAGEMNTPDKKGVLCGVDLLPFQPLPTVHISSGCAIYLTPSLIYPGIRPSTSLAAFTWPVFSTFSLILKYFFSLKLCLQVLSICPLSASLQQQV